MSDNFTRELDQIARDAALPASASRLAIVFMAYMNRSSGDAWPSIGTLANALGVVENCVRKSVKALVANGHLAVEAGGGRNATNRYRPIVKSEFQSPKPCKIVKGIERKKPCKSVKGKNGEKPCTALQGLETKTLHERALNPANPFTKPCTSVHPNPMKNPLSEPIEEESLSPAGSSSRSTGNQTASRKSTPLPAKEEITRAFEGFWKVYPARKGKLAAQKAYERAVASGATAQELELGAGRYAAERNREPDPVKRARFTKHPATWLNQGCWADEPTPQTTASHIGRHLTTALQGIDDYD